MTGGRTVATTWNLSKGLAAVVTASAAAFGFCPSAAADPAAPQPSSTQELPGLPALSQLSPIIQQAASNPGQATQLLMAAAQAFSHNQGAPTESRNVAASVNQFLAEPGAALPDGSPVPHVPAAGVEPGAQSHLPTGIDPAHAAGPGPVAAPPAAAVEPGTQAHLPNGIDPAHAAGPGQSAAPPVAAPPASAPTTGTVAPVAAPAPVPPAPAEAAPAAIPAPAAAPAPAPAAAPAAAPGFGPDAPPTQDFMYPSIGTNCLADGTSAIATALSVAGPAKIPTPGPGPGQTAYVFTAVGTPGPAEVQKLPLNVTWVNLTTGKSGTVALKPRTDINGDGPTTLTAIADTGSGSIMSTIFGQVTTKEKQCQFMPTIGSTVVP
ncbi:Rv1157c family protein [Mycobacterium seoulense]|uniref:Uncharacterized protein n=1 Tax=Mycobacterium seoulense TaxID=386911 RepID=A0A7I7NZQ4_9MYCO|nr:hypothetical protein [Mycobacterium seoulense]MCV7437126.1 hypothetical protein [Mycobacterium seoulense]BBY02127.1 hypothetical protein MSEO_26260 [Mycobacterium seoulense]